MKLLNFLGIFLIVSINSFFVWLTNNKWLYGVDDAMIYKTYMKNFSKYGEWIYNVGGERVEGFSSFLWAYLGSILFKIDDVKYSLFILNLFLVSCLLFILLKFLQKETKQEKLFNKSSVLFIGLLTVMYSLFLYQC